MNLEQPPQIALPNWSVTLVDFNRLIAAAQPRLIRFPEAPFPLVFSCSANGIWPVTRRGYMPPVERSYVDGMSDVLDAIARLMMREPNSSIGGRFSVTFDGAYRTRDFVLLANFELTA